MKKISKLLFMISGILLLLLTACGKTSTASESPSPLLSQTAENDYAAYSGYQFSGKDPWEGTLTLTIINITDGKMEWSFTDSFDHHTLYHVQKETLLQDGQADFDIAGKDVEQANVSFAYQGTIKLSDGKVTVTFLSGAVSEPVSGGSDSYASYHEADSLSSREAVLDKTAEGPYIIYTVQSGDSVHSIAKEYGISTKDLCILNQIVIMETARQYGYVFDDVTEYAKYLFPGEELLVPKK